LGKASSVAHRDTCNQHTHILLWKSSTYAKFFVGRKLTKTRVTHFYLIRTDYISTNMENSARDHIKVIIKARWKIKVYQRELK